MIAILLFHPYFMNSLMTVKMFLKQCTRLACMRCQFVFDEGVTSACYIPNERPNMDWKLCAVLTRKLLFLCNAFLYLSGDRDGFTLSYKEEETLVNLHKMCKPIANSKYEM